MTAHTQRNTTDVTRHKKNVRPVTGHVSPVTSKGFTLIELLVVIGILAVLLAITLI
ncbi:MAG: prepilin-type N-terminal cleavage/methylation domain-containing protein, partial [bacterium]|nr:prepilin-type N-terminal cleavage/methylation domain-containing protein [bacterium]